MSSAVQAHRQDTFEQGAPFSLTDVQALCKNVLQQDPQGPISRAMNTVIRWIQTDMPTMPGSIAPEKQEIAAAFKEFGCPSMITDDMVQKAFSHAHKASAQERIATLFATGATMAPQRAARAFEHIEAHFRAMGAKNPTRTVEAMKQRMQKTWIAARAAVPVAA